MRTIITGGTGLIGRALAKSLAGAGHEVILLSRSPEKVGALPANVRAEKWDGRTGAGWSQFVDGKATIINLAGENLSAKLWTDEQKQVIRQSRLDAGAAVVDAVEKASARPQSVIQSSGVGYYGSDEGGALLDESAPPGEDFLAEVCVEWEASTAAVEAMGVRRPVIRQGVVLSPDATVLKRLTLPFSFFAGGVIGSGKQWLSWIHMADEIAAIRWLIEQPAATGPFNVTAPEPVRFDALAKTLGSVLGRPSWIPAPSFAVRAAFGEMGSMVLEGQRAVPRRLTEMGFTFEYPQIEPALRDLLKKPARGK
jgi:uncharacterized protein (TIGR01777 family)